MRNTSIIGRAASAAFSAAATAAASANKAITEFGKAMMPTRPAKVAAKIADPYNPAVICHPLRFIRERTMVKSKDPKTGQTIWEFGPEYHTARHAANRGNGALVKRMARQIAASAN